MVSLLGSNHEIKIPARAEIWFEISAPQRPIANSAMISTLTSHCQWEDEIVRERTGHLPSNAEVKENEVFNTSFLIYLALGTDILFHVLDITIYFLQPISELPMLPILS